MLGFMSRAALLAIFALPLGAVGSGVATSAPMSRLPTVDSLVEKTHYRYCRRWHSECRYRWGYGWRYRRCMARHGC